MDIRARDTQPMTPKRGTQPGLDPRAMAGVDMIRRTGATQFQIRFSDDEEPVVWIANASYDRPNPFTGRPGTRWETASGMDPTTAIMRLCEQLMDGGECQHCHRPTGFSPDMDALPLDDLGCWYQFDPELATFRRGCEGSDR